MLVAVDFETKPIEPRPDYPPEPVSVAVKRQGCPPEFYSWGHPLENNSTKEEAVAVLRDLWRGVDCDGLIFQNAKFDLAVAEERLGLAWPSITVHDTMPLIFLNDPFAQDLSLKGNAERELGMKPEARDRMTEWLLEHQPAPEKITEKRAPKWTSLAPGSLAGEYAKQDVEMTLALFVHLFSNVDTRAYRTEQRLLPILHDMEKRGVKVSVRRLAKDIRKYTATLEELEAWLRKRLHASELNFDSGQQLADALIKSGAANYRDFPKTTKGNIKTSKDVLAKVISNHEVKVSLAYRSKLVSSLRFMCPWYLTAKQTGGLIFTSWNSTRSREGFGVGARTGRFSSSPNFQNIPKRRPEVPEGMPVPVPELPVVRSYIVPLQRNHVLLSRDYSQQEFRILAHFEDDELCAAYRKQPWLDTHTHIQKIISEITGVTFPRDQVKATGFGLLYGMGVGTLAERNGITAREATNLKASFLRALPGLADLMRDLKKRAANNKPYKTWMGRRYYCERDKHGRTYEYKMVNYLIQGSAAECTKQAIVNYYETKKPDEHLLLTVHDELLVSAKRSASGRFGKQMKRLKEAMEAVEFSVPMLSEGKYSLKNWGALKVYDAGGKQYAYKT